MTTKSDPPSKLQSLEDFLSRIENQGTPLRIDGPSDTYYVLTARQWMVLLGIAPESENGESVPQFAPEDFGLTEADLAAYQARREARRKHIDVGVLEPIDSDLEDRLDHINRIQLERPLSEEEQREREELLNELESAMLKNLEAVAK